MELILITLSACVWMWLYMLVLNLFYLIYGLIFNMEFTTLKLFFVEIKNYGEKTVVEKTKFTPYITIAMRDKNESFKKSTMLSFVSMISTLFLGLFIRSITFSSDSLIFIGVISYNIVALIAILMSSKNIFLCFSNSDEAVIAREASGIAGKISEGIQPGKIEFPITHIPDKINLVSNDQSMRYYLFLYYHYFETRQYDKITPVIKAFEKALPEKYVPYLTGVYYEMVFYYSSLSFMPETAKRYYNFVKKDLENDGDINAKRVLAYYNYFVEKDKDMALKYAEEGLKVWEEFPGRGIALMEKDMLESLIKEINRL